MWCFITEEPNYWTAEYAEYGDRLIAALAARRRSDTTIDHDRSSVHGTHTHPDTAMDTALNAEIAYCRICVKG